MMKKITLLFTFFAVSLGYAQELPFTFTENGSPTLHGVIGDTGGGAGDVTVVNTTDPDDATNDVLSITGNGSNWDNAQVVFANNIDLSDDSNNTITFRFKNTVNDGAHTHALKFEQGSGADTELTFTTEDDQWKTVSLDFPAGLGNFGKMVIFTDFGDGNTASGTYLIDDIAGASHLSVTPVFELPVDFSDEVNDQMFGGDGAGVSIIVDPDDATNNVLQVVGSGQQWDNAQVNFDTPIDLSDDDNNTMRFRIRSTTSDPTEVNEHLLKFEVGNPDNQELTFQTTGTAWTDIELDYPAGLGTYGRMVIMVDWGGGPSVAESDTYLIDDIMAPGATVLGIEDFELSSLTTYPNPTNGDWNISGNSIINRIEVYNVLGKQVRALEPNSNEVLIDGASLNSGMYFARIEGVNGTKTIKLIKE